MAQIPPAHYCSSDARQGRRWSGVIRLGVIQEVMPGPKLPPQSRQVQPASARAEFVQLLRAFLEQRSEASRIISPVMVEGSGHLNQAMQ